MVKVVAAELNNTPAVCRRSYVDPVLVSHFENGRTIAEAVREGGGLDDRAMRAHVERAVLELLAHREPPEAAAA